MLLVPISWALAIYLHSWFSIHLKRFDGEIGRRKHVMRIRDSLRVLCVIFMEMFGSLTWKTTSYTKITSNVYIDLRYIYSKQPVPGLTQDWFIPEFSFSRMWNPRQVTHLHSVRDLLLAPHLYTLRRINVNFFY